MSIELGASSLELRRWGKDSRENIEIFPLLGPKGFRWGATPGPQVFLGTADIKRHKRHAFDAFQVDYLVDLIETQKYKENRPARTADLDHGTD